MLARVTPTVGIPLCVDAQGRWKPGRTYHYVDSAYARAIARAGRVAVYLPMQAEPAQLLERVDALLVPGGDDLLPPRPYPPEVRFEAVPEAQLGFDRALVAAALARGVPLLGICYGMQLLAVELGGALHYDIATDPPPAGPHQLGPGEARPRGGPGPGPRVAPRLAARQGRGGARPA